MRGSNRLRLVSVLVVLDHLFEQRLIHFEPSLTFMVLREHDEDEARDHDSARKSDRRHL